MKKLITFLLAIFISSAHAQIDKRKYVDWSSDPYNKIVGLAQTKSEFRDFKQVVNNEIYTDPFLYLVYVNKSSMDSDKPLYVLLSDGHFYKLESLDKDISLDKDQYARFKIIGLQPNIQLTSDDVIDLLVLENHLFCTGQYVAPNIIATARHCIAKTALFDNYELIGDIYYAQRYDGQLMALKLEKYGENHDFEAVPSQDWALLRILDPDFYSKEHFKPFEKNLNENQDVTNSGFGVFRIISDEELLIIANHWIDAIKTGKYTGTDENGNSVTISKLSDLISHRGFIRDLDKAGVHEKLKQSSVLKATERCALYPQSVIVGTNESNCFTWGGNSGGGAFNEDTLYGVLSASNYSMPGVEKNISYFVTPESYYTEFKELKKQYPHRQKSIVKLTRKTKNNFTQTTQNNNQSIQHASSHLDTGLSTRIAKARAQQREFTVEEIKKMTPQQIFDSLDSAVEYNQLKEIEQLRQEYEDAREREHSTANKILGAAAMAATGIGGMELAAGLAEQKADEAAELDMRAYLATFRCKYGDDKMVRGGEANVELPAGNITELKQQYISLATDLKARKENLGLTPGIESDVILDSATIGLYDDQSLGITDGAYTSLSRALTDENSEDAAEWAAQKEESKQKTKTGAIVGGVGAVGGIVGDLIINRDKDTDNKTNDDKSTNISNIDTSQITDKLKSMMNQQK